MKFLAFVLFYCFLALTLCLESSKERLNKLFESMRVRNHIEYFETIKVSSSDVSSSPVITATHMDVDFKNRIVTERSEERMVRHNDDTSAIYGTSF